MRVLDEIAEALHAACGSPKPRRPITSVALADQFRGPVDAALWRALARRLRCEQPPLQPGSALPAGFATVWDLADWVAWQRPGLEPPAERTERAWREAQVFAGVRTVVARNVGVEPRRIARSTRFVEDLGMD